MGTSAGTGAVTVTPPTVASAALALLTVTLHALWHPEQCHVPIPCSRAFFLSTRTHPGFVAGRLQHTLVYAFTGPRGFETGFVCGLLRDFLANLLFPLGLPVFEERFCVPPDVEENLVDFPVEGIIPIAGDFEFWLFV